ncbi:hypothetical protein M405DRAFT_857787 [Rhizopogon salebrosus TDB-379]|nr:hypothetical protein M405DRAFT_857787 [Rhizopogon salebrosus TDB-379]
MATHVRRRPVTPLPGLPHAARLSHKYPPIRQDQLSADEQREAASKGYGPGRQSHSSGGLYITHGEWKLLAVVLQLPHSHVSPYELLISRHILLDSPLVFFTALTTFFFVGFSNVDKKEPFTEHRWTWLILTGLSLGAVVSCKWVDLFTLRRLCKDVAAFRHSEKFRRGDAFMSSGFRQTLGHGMRDTYADVVFDSEITIRHLKTQGGYLHSHTHKYSGGSGQQQITLYHHGDEKNPWRVLNAAVDDYEQCDCEHKPIVQIEHGTRIKLRHVVTDKAMSSPAGLRRRLPRRGFSAAASSRTRWYSLWYVKTAAKHLQLLANAPKANYKVPGFLSELWELQKVM